jgi:isochorismate synthase EntC
MILTDDPAEAAHAVIAALEPHTREWKAQTRGV